MAFAVARTPQITVYVVPHKSRAIWILDGRLKTYRVVDLMREDA